MNNIAPVKVYWTGPGWYAGKVLFEEFIMIRVATDPADRDSADYLARAFGRGMAVQGWYDSLEEAESE